MQNNTTKIIAAVIAILAIGGVAVFAMNSNKPQPTKDLMSKSSVAMKQTDQTKMAMDKMKAEEAMMKKDTMMSKSSAVDVMKKDGEKMMEGKSSWTAEEMKAMEMTKEADAMPKDAMNKPEELSSPTGMYSQYSVTNLAQNSNGTNVIFFHAPWCPSCRAVEKEINSNLDKLPENFQILKADFDTSTALKQKYGITGQSTFVKVDKDGNKLGTASAQYDIKTVADIVAFGKK